MDEEKRSNQNYEIIESCTIGSTELIPDIRTGQLFSAMSVSARF